jgi:hypothetical protein
METVSAQQCKGTLTQVTTAFKRPARSGRAIFCAQPVKKLGEEVRERASNGARESIERRRAMTT